MKHTKALFFERLDHLQSQLKQASLQGSPALWLYQNDGRTTTFYLEAMSRLLASMTDRKRFDKFKTQFKSLEDALGLLDFYDAWLKEFSANANISADVCMLMEHQRDLAELKLNSLLSKEGWLGRSSKRIANIQAKAKKVDWPSDIAFAKHAQAFYQKATQTLTEELDGSFEDIEADVHELRRNVRWLSIYPQAFTGFFKLEEQAHQTSFDKYLTPQIVNSPFNQLKEVVGVRPVVLSREHFLAMSWLIDALGKIKDQGLRLETLTDALQKVEGLEHDAAVNAALAALGRQQATIEELLDAVREIAPVVKADQVFTGLVCLTSFE